VAYYFWAAMYVYTVAQDPTESERLAQEAVWMFSSRVGRKPNILN